MDELKLENEQLRNKITGLEETVAKLSQLLMEGESIRNHIIKTEIITGKPWAYCGKRPVPQGI